MRRDEYREVLSRLDILEHDVSGVKAGIADLRLGEIAHKLAAATIPAGKELYQRQIEATDRRIDALVYELYGLTEEEVTIVEETIAK